MRGWGRGRSERKGLGGQGGVEQDSGAAGRRERRTSRGRDRLRLRLARRGAARQGQGRRGCNEAWTRGSAGRGNGPGKLVKMGPLDHRDVPCLVDIIMNGGAARR